MAWWDATWRFYTTYHDSLTPIGALIGGAVLAWAALRQARSATRQAEIARLRHEAQTGADQQRRISENFSRAVEQLSSDKIEARLGGIYSLELLSRESDKQYWVVMEILTAFIRERAQRNDAIVVMAKGTGDSREEPPVITKSERGLPTDIAAAVEVILRREEKDRAREQIENWYLNLSGSDLREAHFSDAHLERASLVGAHLEGLISYKLTSTAPT